MKIVIDEKAGYCFGVKNAVGQAEAMLESEGALYSLGHITHNPGEVERLDKLGLQVIDHHKFSNLHDSKVLIRAHGEPPSTYETAYRNRITLIDATCPIVKQVQKMVRLVNDFDEGHQIVIFGKHAHPEVKGLTGQVEEKAIVVQDEAGIQDIDPNKDVHLFAQTTMDAEAYALIAEKIQAFLNHHSQRPEPKVHVYKTVCKQVTDRVSHLEDFASEHQAVLFVSGKESSNGRYLFNVCKRSNPLSYQVQNTSDIDKSWLDGVNSVGITGATSTPFWQLEQVRDFLLA